MSALRPTLLAALKKSGVGRLLVTGGASGLEALVTRSNDVSEWNGLPSQLSGDRGGKGKDPCRRRGSRLCPGIISNGHIFAHVGCAAKQSGQGRIVASYCIQHRPASSPDSRCTETLWFTREACKIAVTLLRVDGAMSSSGDPQTRCINHCLRHVINDGL